MIASHMNVRYGWDFSGILIPALIALQWYQPTKILTSFVEAIVIYVIARLILRLPSMANVTIEGGRKLLLFFNISFAWKMAVGWFIVWQGFDVKTTDFYGFGYLLSTLIAIKAHDKDIFPRLARSTLQVSFMGAVFGNIVGFALSAAVSRSPAGTIAGEGTGLGQSGDTQVELLMVEAVGNAHVQAGTGRASVLSETVRAALAELVYAVEKGVPAASPEFDMSAQGWRLLAVGEDRLAIVRADGSGKDMLVFDPRASRNLAVVLREPAASAGLGVAALTLADVLDARWLVISAPVASGAINAASVADVFADASDAVMLELGATETGRSTIAYANAAAGIVDVPALEVIAPDLQSSIASDVRGGAGSHAALSLDRASLRRLAAMRAPMLRPDAPCRLVGRPGIEAAWSDLDRLAFLRFEVAEPIMRSARDGSSAEAPRASAAAAGFSVALCRMGGRDHWTVYSPQRAEGQLFLQTGGPALKSVLAWREGRSTGPARIGAAIYRNWNGDALFIAPQANSFAHSPRSSMTVFWQELVRQQEGLGEAFLIDLRPQPSDAEPIEGRPHVLLARDVLGAAHPQVENVVSAMRSAGIRTEIADGRSQFAGYEARPGLAERYFAATPGRRYAIGWLTDDAGVSR